MVVVVVGVNPNTVTEFPGFGPGLVVSQVLRYNTGSAIRAFF